MNKKLFFAIILLANFVNGQTYTNGGLSTGATAKIGTVAPSGYTWSELQNNTGNTTESNTALGAPGTFNSASVNTFLADDFTVPPGTQWQISSIDFFAYQTNYTGTTNPFTTVRVNIYSSDPSVAGAVSVFGDDTTNRYNSGADSNMYRIGNSTVPTPTIPGTTRKIWRIRANTSVTLNPGTYWIKYQLQNVISANGGFLPLVTIPGTRGLASFNAKQFNAVAPTSWAPLTDIGNPTSAPDYTVDMPFIVTFMAILGTDEVMMQYDNRIQVYPNPVKETFKISNPEKIKISSVEIIDASGKLIKTMKGAEDYNVSDLPKGNYILKIKSNELTKITKLLKQ